MLSSTELKKELAEIQSLADSKFQENIYQRLLITTITLLIIISILILTISFFIRFTLNDETLLGDFLLNLGTDFVGSTIIFIAFSVTLKPKSPDSSKNNFLAVTFGVLAVGVIAFTFAFANNEWRLLTYSPYETDSYIIDKISRVSADLPSDATEEDKEMIYNFVYQSDLSRNIFYMLDRGGYINRHYEIYFGQDFVNALLLNISTQFIGALIIFVGIEQLFQLFERQQDVQQSMLKRIEQLAMKVE